MNRCFSRYTLLLLALLASNLQAGTLWLVNGDKIFGEPDELSGGTLLWISDSAGPLKINQINIRFIQTNREMVVQIGQEALLDGCHLEVDDGKPVMPVPQPASAAAEPGETTAADKQSAPAGGSRKPNSKAPTADASSAEQDSDKIAKSEQPQAAAENNEASPPEQWIMCKEKGFPIGSWKQVARFFEYKPPEPDTMKPSGSILLVIEDESGNTDERTIDWDIQTEFRYQKSRHIITWENTLESTSGKDTKDERKLTYKYDRFFTDRWFWAGNGSWEENKFKDLSSKWILGGGVGYQFFETELLKLSTEGGLSYIDEEFNNDDEPRDYPALRSATNFRWVLNESGLEFFHSNLFFQSLQETTNWNLESDTGFSMPIIGHFKANFIFEYDYDNSPATGAKKEDRIWKIGFSYVWP